MYEEAQFCWEDALLAYTQVEVKPPENDLVGIQASEKRMVMLMWT